MRKRRRRIRFTVRAVRNTNTYTATGLFEPSLGGSRRLDDLVIDHLMTVRRLSQLSPPDRAFMELAVENHTRGDIARAIGTNKHTVDVIARRIEAASEVLR